MQICHFEQRKIVFRGKSRSEISNLLLVFIHQHRESMWNHGSHPEIMIYVNMSDRTKENNFSGQIKVRDSESVTGLVHQHHESPWNHGSHPKMVTLGNMSFRTKENRFSGQIKVGDFESVIGWSISIKNAHGTMGHIPKL